MNRDEGAGSMPEIGWNAGWGGGGSGSWGGRRDPAKESRGKALSGRGGRERERERESMNELNTAESVQKEE